MCLVHRSVRDYYRYIMSILIIVLYCDIATESVEVYYSFIIIIIYLLHCEKGQSTTELGSFYNHSWQTKQKYNKIVHEKKKLIILLLFEITLSGDYSVNIRNLVPNNRVIIINK